MSELNRFMDRPGPCVVRVASTDLLLDTPVYPRSHCNLDLDQTVLHSTGHKPYQIQIKERSDVLLQGGQLTGGKWGVSVTRSCKVAVLRMHMDALGGGGVMTGSYDVSISHNRFMHLGGSSVMLHGDTQHTVIAENEILADKGWSNWHAGIVITDRIADPGDDATTLLRTDGYLVKQTRITDRLTIPHDNPIFWNRIEGNLTSGIYSDEGTRNVYLEILFSTIQKKECAWTMARLPCGRIQPVSRQR